MADIAASLNMGAPAASADAAMERKVAAAAPPPAAAAGPGASPKLMSFAEIYSAAEIGTPAHGYNWQLRQKN
ncbi:MAG: hypothetical protein FJW31_24870 [Acidobacteria bacterium]|nr:hypothetical protein [Acidobacteriota bacterium]